MKILQIFGAVIAIHVAAFIFIFASPGCQTGPRSIPTPDATIPSGATNAGVAYAPSDLSSPTAPDAANYSSTTSGTRSDPIRPGSANAAAVTPPKPAPKVAPVSTYSVQRGDSLWSISKRNNLTVAELAKANNVSTGATLQPGQKLIIPGKAAPDDEAKDLSTTSTSRVLTQQPATPPRPTGESVKHVVQPGESLVVIARRYGVRVVDVALANNITDPAKIRAGQELTIPGASTRQTTARKETSPPKQQQPAQPQPEPAPDAEETTDVPTVRTTGPRFDITPPPPGQDLDAGLKDVPVEVPTIKVEEPKENPPKG